MSSDEISDAEADQLMSLLGEALDVHDPVPASLERFAVESRRLLDIESELAVIVADSALLDVAGTRATGGLRTVEFAYETVTVRMEFEDDVVACSVNPENAELLLVTQDGSSSLVVNERGFTRFDVPAGPFRLAILAGDVSVRTDWVRLK